MTFSLNSWTSDATGKKYGQCNFESTCLSQDNPNNIDAKPPLSPSIESQDNSDDYVPSESISCSSEFASDNDTRLHLQTK